MSEETTKPVSAVDEEKALLSDADIESRYTRRDEMIAMRDGVRLYTEIYAPVDQEGPLPVILLRTPYQASSKDGSHTHYFDSAFRELAKDKYIFAVQDARGRFKSEGDFVWNRPVAHHVDQEAIDASTDAYDTIEWLVKNGPENNGRVGMLGISYPGWYTTMALVNPHPALKAASPQASPSDYFVNDDFFHNCAFRLGPSSEFPYMVEFDSKAVSRFPYDQVDVYEFFLDLGPISNMNERYMKGALPAWNNFLAHPTYDDFWELGGTLQHLTEVTVPTLHVVGWWDAENLGGALDIYDVMEPLDTQNINSIVVGPWFHGQWDNPKGLSLGAYEFGSDTTEYYQHTIQSPWFAYWLKDEGDLDHMAEAIMFQTGSNEWNRYDQWPPTKLTQERNLYFQSDGELSFEAPDNASDDPYVTYRSDPANPVPYSARPIMGFWQGFLDTPLGKDLDEAQKEKIKEDDRFRRDGRLWKVEDQRFVSERPDVISFVTEPLTDDIEIAGEITVELHASTTGSDADWIVKLIDVYPEVYPDQPQMGGYQLMIADDVLRGKFRNGLKTPEPITPGDPTAFTVDLRTRNHLFRQGHRIMVQVQSSWFPLIDRNPQVFTNIPTAKEEDFQPAEHRVYVSPDHPSHIALPVVRAND
ncbi:MAG: CocE/NonD family hydrolase [Pseudomonadota bacterium]